ncbi:MAG: V-type ATP synthase subunit E [Halobacteriales archaeon]|nr:V-type ATP synthase subunit E [Halobacteriales archaeon]
MSLETVVEDIRETARERADELLAEAEAEADRIVSEAEADAESVLAEAEADVERQIDRERDQQRSSATLEAKQRRLEARRDELAEVREAAEAAVAGLEGETREELTRALLDDAATEFEGLESVSVYGAESDAELLESIAADYDGFEHAGAVDCIGGVVVESDESRLRVNNTFDSVLEQVWDEELRAISDRLFDS